MKLIPYNRFQIDTFLSAPEVLKRIQENTSERAFFKPSSSSAFCGKVDETGFDLVGNIRYRNSFLPVMKGKVEANKDRTRVSVSMRLNLFVMCFMLFWLAVTGGAGIYILLSVDTFSLPLLIPLGMFLFGIALTCGGFWFEALRQERKLRQIISTWQ